MKSKKSKQEQSQELAEQIQKYLNTGGEVKEIPNGISGNTLNANLFKSSAQIEPKSPRTPLTEVVKTLEARKSGSDKKPEVSNKKPQKKLIVDDFGDPVRWVWEE